MCVSGLGNCAGDSEDVFRPRACSAPEVRMPSLHQPQNPTGFNPVGWRNSWNSCSSVDYKNKTNLDLRIYHVFEEWKRLLPTTVTAISADHSTSEGVRTCDSLMFISLSVSVLTSNRKPEGEHLFSIIWNSLSCGRGRCNHYSPADQQKKWVWISHLTEPWVPVWVPGDEKCIIGFN